MLGRLERDGLVECDDTAAAGPHKSFRIAGPVRDADDHGRWVAVLTCAALAGQAVTQPPVLMLR